MFFHSSGMAFWWVEELLGSLRSASVVPGYVMCRGFEEFVGDGIGYNLLFGHAIGNRFFTRFLK